MSSFAPTTVATTSPRSFVFYVVADVGPRSSRNTHRPLAVTYRQGHGKGPSRGSDNSKERVDHVLEDCARIFDVLTEPANRVALEAELALAAAWYQGEDYSEPDRVEILDAPQPGFDFGELRDPQYEGPGEPERPELPCASGLCEFPFISSCLRLSLNGDEEYETRLGDVQEQPLGTTFYGNKLEYGMVIIDISELDNIRYGIIGSVVTYIAEVAVYSPPFGWDRIETQSSGRDPVIRLDKSRSRAPLSATGYMKKHGLFDKTAAARRLVKRSQPGRETLTYIWPRSSSSSQWDKDVDAGPSAIPQSDLDRAVESAIQAAKSHEKLDLGTYEEFLSHPDFQACLLNRLRRKPTVLGSSEPSTQLLRWAYTGHSHLNWVTYTGLSYTTIAAAVDSTELRDAEALSICTDHTEGDAAPLLEALGRCETIRKLCFLQGPARADDDSSREFFLQICSSLSASSLFRSRAIFLTCAFSNSLQKKPWLPELSRMGISHDPLTSAFPVQHMFVRQEIVHSSTNAAPKVFHPSHFFLGDALLRPERLVMGFLAYCCSMLTDKHLLSFATVPSSLASYETEFPGKAIGPMPAENLAVPKQCSIPSSAGDDIQVDCGPLFRGLDPGGWVLLVSSEWHVSSERRSEQPESSSQDLPAHTGLAFPIVRYAFLRARKRIPEPSLSDLPLESLVQPDYIEVAGGVKDLLQRTAPEVDEDLVGLPFQKTIASLQERRPASRGSGTELISVLDDDMARSMLVDFLEDSIFIRHNLMAAAHAIPDVKDWYPTLLSESPKAVGARSRNRAVFQSLHDPNVQGQQYPLGTRRPIRHEPFYPEFMLGAPTSPSQVYPGYDL